jgi:hypothetical protein
MVPSSASRGVPNPRMESVPDSGASFCGFLFTTVGALRPASWKDLDQFSSIESEPGLIESAPSGRERLSLGTVGKES